MRKIDILLFLISKSDHGNDELREVYDDYLGNVGGLEQHVLSRQRRERAVHRGVTHSDEEDDELCSAISMYSQ